MTELSLVCIYQQMQRIRDFFAGKNGKKILSAKHFGYKVSLPMCRQESYIGWLKYTDTINLTKTLNTFCYGKVF